MLKEKAALLQKHDSELFGKKFRNHIADTIKSKRETREIFTESRKPFPWSSSYPWHGKCTFFKQNLLQHEFSYRNKLKMGTRKCSPIDKKIVLHKQSSKRSNSRKTKTFLKGLEKINQGSEYPGFSR